MPIPRGRGLPVRAISSITRPANRRASSRNFGSVAAVRSASMPSTSSGASFSASSTAASSSSPTSGDICSKRSCRARSLRETVFLFAWLSACSASAPSLTAGFASSRSWPQSGRQLFPLTRLRLSRQIRRSTARSPLLLCCAHFLRALALCH